MSEQPEIAVVMGSGPAPNPPAELSDYTIQQIHAGLVRPNDFAILSMSREIRKWRGVANPDLI